MTTSINPVTIRNCFREHGRKCCLSIWRAQVVNNRLCVLSVWEGPDDSVTAFGAACMKEDDFIAAVIAGVSLRSMSVSCSSDGRLKQDGKFSIETVGDIVPGLVISVTGVEQPFTIEIPIFWDFVSGMQHLFADKPDAITALQDIKVGLGKTKGV